MGSRDKYLEAVRGILQELNHNIAQANLMKCERELRNLQVYWAFRYHRGWRGTSLGPSCKTQRQMALT